MSDLALDDDQLLQHCQQRRGLSSGPGGQHAQKTQSAITLIHRSGVQAQCGESRDGQRNLRTALGRLRLQLALSQRGGSDPAWLQPFRHGQRLRISANNRAYPQVVAVLLDALAEHQGRVAAAAAALACSTSQMVKVLAAHKAVWAAALSLLRDYDQPPLRHP